LLDIERIAAEERWLTVHPAGEVRRLDSAVLEQLSLELSSASLFATQRLVVVRDASAVLEVRQGERTAADAFLAVLDSSWDRDTSLLLCAPLKSEPKGPVADYLRAHGTLTWLPLPPTPKPWEDVRLSEEQRRTLEGLLRRTVPGILPHRALVAVLMDHLGFKPRQLVQTAERLLLAGQLDAEQVRAELGPGEHSIDELEKALLERDGPRLARVLAALSAGGDLVNWRGERITPGGVVPVLSQWLHRLLRSALAMRAYARRCGLAGELDADRCAQPRWYSAVFQKRIHPLLEREIATQPLAEASVWQRHRVFRLAARYSDHQLRRALASLSRLFPERERETGVALAMLAEVLLDLVTATPTATDTAAGG
jgi:hypothetical protein